MNTRSAPNPLAGFHPIADLAAGIGTGENTRRFMGEGTMFLKVPGLKKLEAVHIAGRPMPQSETISYPVDLGMRQESIEVPLVHLTHLPDGTPVLLRNIISNQGHWQMGMEVAVTGEWDERVPAPKWEPPAPEPVKKGRR